MGAKQQSGPCPVVGPGCGYRTWCCPWSWRRCHWRSWHRCPQCVLTGSRGTANSGWAGLGPGPAGPFSWALGRERHLEVPELWTQPWSPLGLSPGFGGSQPWVGMNHFPLRGSPAVGVGSREAGPWKQHQGPEKDPASGLGWTLDQSPVVERAVLAGGWEQRQPCSPSVAPGAGSWAGRPRVQDVQGSRFSTPGWGRRFALGLRVRGPPSCAHCLFARVFSLQASGCTWRGAACPASR